MNSIPLLFSILAFTLNVYVQSQVNAPQKCVPNILVNLSDAQELKFRMFLEIVVLENAPP